MEVKSNTNIKGNLAFSVGGSNSGSRIVKKDLFDTNASLFVLSCLMRNPLLLQDDKYAFCKTDFYKPLQEMIFYVIYNMAQSGVSKIVPQDIDLYLKQFSAQYDYYKQNKGYEFVLQCFQTAEGSDQKQFDTYYNRVKKFALLRDLESQGIDTTRFYDTTKDTINRDIEDDKLNKLSLESILNDVRGDLASIENKHVGKDNGNSQTASKGMRELVKSFEDNPEVGLPLSGTILNWSTRGARLGKLYLYSAPSGGGKTRYMVGNACAICFPYIDEDMKIVARDDFRRILFVATEMKADEIQTLILSCVSGVNEKNIILGNYTEEQKQRIKLALDIIDEYGDNFIIECIPDPSIAMVKARLIKYILQDEIEYIFYDYIFSSPGLLSEFRDVAVREDVALMMLSNTLKEVAMSYNVFIQSGTQLNDGWSRNLVGARDQNCIRGSKAIADKADIGLIGVKMSPDEFAKVEAIWSEVRRLKKFSYDKPNIVVDIYKNRRGEMNNVKIFRYFDFATCRSVDLFVTDTSYRLLEVTGELKYEVNRCDLLELKTRRAKERQAEGGEQ